MPPADVTCYIFPWVEAELEALDQRVAQLRCNQDIALRQFLKLLQWLRIVLVQDCALLHAHHPHCPIFKFAPFTFPSFTAFSANAAALVTAAEEKARLAFHNLPDHMAQSMRGYATDLQMRQELIFRKLSAEIQELKEQNAQLMLSFSASSRGSKRRAPGKSLSLIQDSNPSSHIAQLVYHSVMPPPPTVPSPATFPPPGLSVQPPAPAVTNFPSPFPLPPSLSAITINLSDLSTNPTVSATSSSVPIVLPAPVDQPSMSLTPLSPHRLTHQIVTGG